MKLWQKSVKNFVGFLGDIKTPKFHSEIIRPLANIHCLYRLRSIKVSKYVIDKQNIFLASNCAKNQGRHKHVFCHIIGTLMNV